MDKKLSPHTHTRTLPLSLSLSLSHFFPIFLCSTIFNVFMHILLSSTVNVVEEGATTKIAKMNLNKNSDIKEVQLPHSIYASFIHMVVRF